MKPILFNTEMVKSLLDGRKTVTRRVVKPQPCGIPYQMPMASTWPHYFGQTGSDAVFSPPYWTGDVLWVRETWTTVPDGSYVYKASVECPDAWKGTWRPSIHMPKEAARLFLRVTSVWVERLQEITPQQIDAEGCCEYAYDAKTGKPAPTGPSWFKILWDKTIKPAEQATYGWKANPWVWVIGFERIGREEAHP